MKRNTSIQLKASLLLIIFSLNMVVGFACSVGMNLGLNIADHHEETEVIDHHHSHHHDKSHHHDVAGGHHHSKDKKDNCCNDPVTKFSQLDKSVPQSLNTAINPIFFTSFVYSFYNINILAAFEATTNIKYFVRSYHPPISDIRVAIQSFQI
ncbi:hypothetical protein SAMN04488505_102573 [Chitinophaga rupis]|uniref:Uncharacterized protein n=1 Tax=Chitinophaga rupis TaxID=573321 RepID=A0A1H7RAK1_9BACT|nr:hypothetical protein [Chitinophaga rupis]SEL56998.1 hypothetical protein SAMN04488505_102573 [Chitinophaga rupis]